MNPSAPHCDPAFFDLGMPVLGICYGMQLACHILGGKVKPAAQLAEFGRAPLPRSGGRRAFRGRADRNTVVWMSHGDQVQASQRRLRAAGRDRHLSGGRGDAIAAGRSTACNSIPRSATRRTAAASFATSSTTSAAARACGR